MKLIRYRCKACWKLPPHSLGNGPVPESGGRYSLLPSSHEMRLLKPASHYLTLDAAHDDGRNVECIAVRRGDSQKSAWVEETE